MSIDETFLNIGKIIERDRKSSTYKFALLRGTIDIIQDNSPFIKCHDELVAIPMGLMIEKWLIYYYPLLESKIKIPQINGEKKPIAFAAIFRNIIDHYNFKNGLSGFYNDLKSKEIDQSIKSEFFTLVSEMRSAIVNGPMRYIGGSITNNNNSIYKFHASQRIDKSQSQNALWLIENFGTFTIPLNYYKAFKLLGSFISGTDNILFKWAEFSVNASKKRISTEKAIQEILKSPITDRDVACSKSLYMEMLNAKGNVHCVWNGDLISVYDVDHLIPFSIWKNNDLWNLLPAKKLTNNRKRDKIPSAITLIKQKDLIIYYWEMIGQKHPQRFFNEIQVSLLGKESRDNWQEVAFNQLLNTSKYLINTRGYSEWEM